jgi:competence protein ComFC
MKLIIILLNKVLDLVYPKFCFGCRSSGTYLCRNCIKLAMYINWEQRCHICGNICRLGMVHKECEESSYLDGLIYITLYDGIAKKLIKSVKYDFNFAVLEDIGILMAKFLKFYKLNKGFVLVPVPLSNKKRRYRGFNQAELLGKHISKNSNFEQINLLKRIKNTHTQVTLSKQERSINLKEAFQINMNLNNMKSFKKVILVDDVYTTGTTLNECAKVLKQSGVEEVIGFVFAKSKL